MKTRLAGLLAGTALGFVLAWARLTDPSTIRSMLLLREADAFLLMGAAVLVAAVGARLLRAAGARALITGEPIGWTLERPSARHFAGRRSRAPDRSVDFSPSLERRAHSTQGAAPRSRRQAA